MTQPTGRPLFTNGDLITDLQRLIRTRQTAMRQTPGLLANVLRSQAWRDFTTSLGEHITHGDFEGFLTAAPPAGLGISASLAYSVAEDDAELLDLLDSELRRPESHTATIRADSPRSVADALRRHLSPDQLTELRMLLFEER